jgi:hypothetical protein
MATMVMTYRAAFAAIAVAMAVSAPARADTILLDLINAGGQTDTPFSLNFNATDVLTTLTFAGYQVPSIERATHIGVFLNNAGANLLGSTWTFTPAPSGSLASQTSDGTGVNQLNFGGVTAGSYDSFAQQFATTAGSSYTVNFLFSNPGGVSSAPSGLRVSTSGIAGIPEPATWGMMLLGFGGLGAILRLRRRTLFA